MKPNLTPEGLKEKWGDVSTSSMFASETPSGQTTMPNMPVTQNNSAYASAALLRMSSMMTHVNQNLLSRHQDVLLMFGKR
jgi:hypothetical protein